jgi:hypothetical protein
MSLLGALVLAAGCGREAPDRPESRKGAPGLPALSVADFLPAGHVTDGSVSYRAQVQKAIDTAARQGRVLVFGPMTYAAGQSGW